MGTHYSRLRPIVENSAVVRINFPLTPATQGSFDRELLYRVKKGRLLDEHGPGRIVDTEALIEVMESGHLANYAGDVWYPQPAPAGDPCHKMPSRAVTLRLLKTSRGPEPLLRRDQGLPRELLHQGVYRPRLHHPRRRPGNQL